MNTSLGIWRPGLRVPIYNSSTSQLFFFEQLDTSPLKPVHTLDHGSTDGASMAPVISSSPRHVWKAHDRIVVALLFVFFKVSPQEMTDIFNRTCSERLLAEGFETGVLYSTIRSQLGDLRGEGSGNLLYKSIENMSFRQVREKYRDEKERIEDVAQELGIVLQIQVKSQRPLFTSSSRSKRRRIDERQDTPATHVWVSDTSDDEIVETPSKPPRKHKFATNVEIAIPRRLQAPLSSSTSGIRRFTHSPKVVVSSLRSKLNYDGQEGQKHPLFLFRTFETSHGFTARKFLGSVNNIPHPPKIESEDFLAYVGPHLHVIKTYDSPFISLAQNPKNALQDKRLKPSPELSFSIFLYNDIERDATERFGTESGPFLTPTICRIHESLDLPRSPSNSKTPYTGKGEFLVWGGIRCLPLGVLDAAQAILVRSVMETMAVVDRNSGFRIGRCLHMIASDWRASVAYQLLWAYGVPGHITAKRSSQGNAFFQGVEDAAKSCPPSAVQEPEQQPILDQSQRFPMVTRDMWSDSEESLPVLRGNDPKENEDFIPAVPLDLRQEEGFRSEDEELLPLPTTFSKDHGTTSSFTVPLVTANDTWRSEDEEPWPATSGAASCKIPVKPRKIRALKRSSWRSSLEHPQISRTMTILKSEEQIEKSTLSIARKLDRDTGYLSDGWSTDSQSETSNTSTPATSTTVSPTERNSGSNLTLKPSTVELFKQQVSHFAAEKTPPATTANKLGYATPAVCKGTMNTSFDLTTSEDGRAMTSEEEYEDVIRSIQARRRDRQHNALSLRSRSTGAV